IGSIGKLRKRRGRYNETESLARTPSPLRPAPLPSREAPDRVAEAAGRQGCHWPSSLRYTLRFHQSTILPITKRCTPDSQRGLVAPKVRIATKNYTQECPRSRRTGAAATPSDQAAGEAPPAPLASPARPEPLHS